MLIKRKFRVIDINLSVINQVTVVWLVEVGSISQTSLIIWIGLDANIVFLIYTKKLLSFQKLSLASVQIAPINKIEPYLFTLIKNHITFNNGSAHEFSSKSLQVIHPQSLAFLKKKKWCTTRNLTFCQPKRERRCIYRIPNVILHVSYWLLQSTFKVLV